MLFLPYRSSSGSTLIELLIVLAIVGILITSATGDFSQIFAKNQQESILSALLSHHHLARSEAIKNNKVTLLCKSNNGQQCTPEAQWHHGWILFQDLDNNKKVGTSERIYYVQQSLHNNLTLNYRGFGSHNYIRYFPNGRSTSNGTFTLCNKKGEAYKKAFIIARTGRARISHLAPGNKALVCS